MKNMNRYNLAGVLLMALFGLTFGLKAQVTDLGEPYGWQSKEPLNVDVVILQKIDVEELKSEDAINNVNKTMPYRFGYEHLVNYDVLQTPSKLNVDGGEIFRVEFDSKDATTMNVFFNEFELGPGEYVNVFDAEGKHYDGAYTAENNQEDFMLSTLPMPTNKLVVEFFKPFDSEFETKLLIGHVVQGYREVAGYFVDALHTAKGLNDSGNCNYDVGCTQQAGNPFGAVGEWDDQIASVALMLLNGSRWCSASLINNTANDGTPYVLSADHCGTGNGGGRSFIFGYKSSNPSCATSTNSTDGPTTAIINGAVLRASNSGSDVALWEMSSTPPASFDVYYAGWDRSGNRPTEVTGIHHPSGDVMKICREEDSPFEDVAAGAQVWWINEWEWGVTEPGSSGSPIFDQNKRIVGQLYGGLAACSGTVDNNQFDYYGRFDVSWNNGGSASSRLSDWLDPLGSNPVTLDGFDPNQPSANLDAQVQGINGVSGFSCNQETFSPSVDILNAGNSTLTSLSITYTLDGVSIGTTGWTGSLVSGDVATVALPNLNITSSGNYTYGVTVSNPNGGTDENPSNNSGASNFETAVNASSPQLDITFDCWPNEISWQLTSDASGSIIASGDGYPGDADGQTFTETFCLGQGCYTFTIFDSYGDGMNGSAYDFCGFDGSYQIVDGADVLVEMAAPDANFGSSATHTFCIDGGGGEVPCQQPYPQVQNLTTTPQSNGILLEWDPILGSIGCQVQGGIASSSGLASFQTIAPNASSFLAPASQLQNGQTYRWRVRCGCTTSIIGPWSDFDFFTWNPGSKVNLASNYEFQVYPNPSNGDLNVSFSGNADGFYQFLFVDLQGRVVLEYQREIQGAQFTRFDITGLDSGVYLLQVTHGDKTITERVIKQ
ncbi:MAG: T9SS type A sorting domain-containing protein [Flavobacteriales bacterium]|nr:T9SS type A sorting domain-containing protein [Flavobacteriales bacterium]